MTTVPLVRALSCPSCGAAIESHLGSWSTTVACTSCSAVLDSRSELLQVLQAAERTSSRKLAIPLGSRGTFDGDPFEAVGWQERRIYAEGETFSWREYVLFNPYLGFRYLSEYDGHWNVIRPIDGARPTVSDDRLEYAGSNFRHFQTTSATTTAVLGEFPWEVRRGDVVATSDYVAPPMLLGCEEDSEGKTWSLGTYVEPDVITTAFSGTRLALPSRVGVFANQPSPWAGVSQRFWKMATAGVVLLLLVVGSLLITRQNAGVFQSSYQFMGTAVSRAPEDAVFVTPLFALKGSGNVRLSLRAQVDNAWVGAGISLIDADRGNAYDTILEVGRYSGYDGGESWSEGSYSANYRIPAVPAGNYYLRIAPDGDTPAEYTVRVVRDSPVVWYLFPALFALLLPPLIVSIAAASFEHRRWMESDHPPVSSSAGDDDDE